MVDLVAAAASALVGAIGTDAWGWMKAGLARVFGETADQSQVSQRLERSAADLDGLSGAELDRAQARVQGAWQTRLADLVEDDPAAADRLAELLAQVQARGGQVVASGPVIQQATASDHAQQAVLGQGTQHVTFGGTGGSV